MLLKVWSVGEAHGERNVERIKSAFLTKAANVAVLWIMPKDHKPVIPGKPMASRPVVSITTSMLVRASKLITNIIRALADAREKRSETNSCEDLKANLVKLNKVTKAQAKQKAIELLGKEKSTKLFKLILC